MSTPCEQAENIKKLMDYTGINPLSNGNSLRGQIDALRNTLQRATYKQNVLFIVIATVITTLVIASTWATRNDSETVMEAARQISIAADSIKAARP